MKIYIIHSKNFDYKSKLYDPLRSSALNKKHEIFLPHESDQHENSKELMETSDLLIAEVSLPSTGEGIELGRAEAINLPILAIHEKGASVFRSIKYVTSDVIDYSDSDDMLEKLEAFLEEFTPNKF